MIMIAKEFPDAVLKAPMCLASIDNTKHVCCKLAPLHTFYRAFCRPLRRSPRCSCPVFRIVSPAFPCSRATRMLLRLYQ